jgi:hypothetical protein
MWYGKRRQELALWHLKRETALKTLKTAHQAIHGI